MKHHMKVSKMLYQPMLFPNVRQAVETGQDFEDAVQRALRQGSLD
jgi:hypothetical protein